MFAVKEREIYMPKIPYSKRPDGRYYKQIVIGFDTNGKRKTKTLYDKDWRKLDKKVKEFCVSAEQGVFVRDDITLEECVNLWLRTKRDIKPTTLHAYQIALKHVEPIQHMLLKNLKLIHIQAIYERLYLKNTIDTIWVLNTLLKNIFTYAINNNFMTVNLAEKTTLPKKNPQKRRGLTENEKHAIFDHFESFSRFEQGYLMLLYYTGMRRNEILALQKKDIDFTKNYINVHKTLVMDKDYKTVVQMETKTAAGMREVPMIKVLKKFLIEYTENLSEDDFLFLSNRGNLIQPGVSAYKWKCILKKINQHMPEGEVTNITPHYFRHNFTTDLVYAGVPLKTVQAIMGHENIQTTMDIYADVRYDNNDVIHKLSSYLG